MRIISGILLCECGEEDCLTLIKNDTEVKCEVCGNIATLDSSCEKWKRDRIERRKQSYSRNKTSIIDRVMDWMGL